MKVILIMTYITLASNRPATSYGWGERMCGDVGKPVACSSGAITASGRPLRPLTQPSIAVAAPANIRMPKEGVWVHVRLVHPVSFKALTPCVHLHVTDKMNEKWLTGDKPRGWDITPAALARLGVNPSPWWSGTLALCPASRKWVRNPVWEAPLHMARMPR